MVFGNTVDSLTFSQELRPVGARGAGGAMAPLDFGRSVTPISTKGGGDRLCPLHYYCSRPQIFTLSYGPGTDQGSHRKGGRVYRAGVHRPR